MIRNKTLRVVEKVLDKEQIRDFRSSKGILKKGFTLVELIVVLVILAIIAAVAIPAMLGFTDDAKEKQYITEAKEAMAASQAMLSDAYTDNLRYVPASMRDKARETSGLDNTDDTEFVIWTEDSFRVADGTADTIRSYSVNYALYAVNKNTFVYYDGSKWEVSDDIQVIGDRLQSNAVYNQPGDDIFSGNYITVWPSNSQSAKKDTAYNIIYADGDTEGKEDLEDLKHDDDKDTSDNESEMPSEDTPGVTLIFHVPDPVNGHKTAHFAGNKDTYSTDFVSDGMSGNTVNSVNPTIDTDYFKADTLKWGTTTDSSTHKSFAELMAELAGMYNTSTMKYGVIVDVYGSIDDKTIDIPVRFETIESSALTVSNPGGEGTSFELTYNIPRGTFDAEDILPSSVSAGPSNSSLNNLVKFDGKWAIWQNQNGEYVKTASEIDRVTVGGLKTRTLALVNEYAADNSDNITAALETLSTAGYTYKAAADIFKTVYVRGIIKEGTTNELKGDVTFENAGDDGKIFDETFAYNELTEKTYTTTGSGASVARTDNVIYSDNAVSTGESVFTDHAIKYKGTPIQSTKMKVKFWNIYSSDSTYSVGDALTKDTTFTNREQYDCTEEIIEKLFYSGYNRYGEVAEIDVADITTKIVNNDSGQSDVRGYFIGLVKNNSASNINSINYVDSDSVPAPEEVYKEVCISETTVKSGTDGKLARDKKTQKYDVNVRDEKYPAYTVAYSKESTEVSGKYDIYVVTEDHTDMKIEGTLQKMNNGFSDMTANTVTNHFETSEVTDMSGMYLDCKKLVSINLSKLNTSSVTDMNRMFMNCNDAISIVMSQFDTSNVEDMSYMFYDCKKITELDLKSFDASNVKTMESMFEMKTGNASNQTKNNLLTKILFDKDRLNVSSNIETVKAMFKNCDSLTGLDLRGFKNCSNLQSIQDWFNGCKFLTYIDLSNFETSANSLYIIEKCFYDTARQTAGDKDLFNDKGCKIFALKKWEVNEERCNDKNIENFNYLRINLFGKFYKNANGVKIDGITKERGHWVHLDVQESEPILVTNGTGDGGNRYNHDNNYCRVVNGYFIKADTSAGSYYDTWKKNNNDYK